MNNNNNNNNNNTHTDTDTHPHARTHAGMLAPTPVHMLAYAHFVRRTSACVP